jgi:hypothetical protein
LHITKIIIILVLKKMSMKKLSYLALILTGGLIITSCNQRLIDFTVISSKNVTLRLPDDAKGPRTQGKDMKMCTQPMLKAAVDKAIENAGQGYDALIDGVIYSRNELFRVGWVVEGTPIKTSKLKASN